VLILQREFLQAEVQCIIKQRILEPECEKKEDWTALAYEFKRCNFKILNGLGKSALILVFL
jgi:hypothetical protein